MNDPKILAKIKDIKGYETTDGKLFKTLYEAHEHQLEIDNGITAKVQEWATNHLSDKKYRWIDILYDEVEINSVVNSILEHHKELLEALNNIPKVKKNKETK